MGPPQVEATRLQFASVFQETLILGGATFLITILGGVTLFLASHQGVRFGPFEWFLFIAWLAVAFGLLAITYDTWRCPVCGSYLGQGFWGIGDVVHCMSCGTRLK